MSNTKYAVPAIQRASTILDHLAAYGPSSLKELDQRLTVAKSTLYNLLESMHREGWVEKLDGTYAIGMHLYELGSRWDRSRVLTDSFTRHARPWVVEYNETTQIAVLDGASVLYIGREDAGRPVRLVSDIGARLPANACALGKALLSDLPPEVISELLPEDLPRLTERTITNLTHLAKALEETRREGVAWDWEEVASGLVCVAAPIRDATGDIAAAVSTSLPVSRMASDYEDADLASAIRKLANSIEDYLIGQASDED